MVFEDRWSVIRGEIIKINRTSGFTKWFLKKGGLPLEGSLKTGTTVDINRA